MFVATEADTYTIRLEVFGVDRKLQKRVFGSSRSANTSTEISPRALADPE